MSIIELALQPIETAVETAKGNYPSLPGALAKVRKVLRQYAESKEITLSKLRMVDICNDLDRFQLNHALVKFVEKYFEKKKQVYQAKSRLMQILKAVFGEDTSKGEDELYVRTIVPEFLSSLLPVLGRQNGGGKNKTWHKLRLSDCGQKVLNAILEVVHECGITNMDAVFTTHRKDVHNRIREISTAKERNDALRTFNVVRKRLNYPSVANKYISKAIPLEDFPPLLKQQVMVFMEKAPLGLESEPHLRERAAQKGISIKRLEQSTIGLYVTRISHALGRMEIDDYESLDIRRLLKIEVETQLDEFGHEYIHLYNPYVEQFREIERFRESDRRDKGFDSKQFAVFLNAIKAVAVFNGIFHLHESFGKAYSIVLDRRSAKNRSEDKKRVFDREWIDSEIERLGEKFYAIIRTKSFRFVPGANYNDPCVRNMRFCLFYVALVMLRYMGWRQQCLRNCEVGKHLVIEDNGVIKFHWSAEEIKNDREISSTLHPLKDRDLLGIFMDVLTAYYKRIYPFIRKTGGVETERQLLVYIRYGKFYRYQVDNAGQFYARFKNDSLEYINFGDRLREFRTGLHPHFFRGMCSDWLYFDIGLSEDNAARYIGDSVHTFRMTYLDRNLAYDTKEALNEARENLRLKREADAVISNGSDDVDDEKTLTTAELERLHQLELTQSRLLLEEALKRKTQVEEELLRLKQEKVDDEEENSSEENSS